MSQDFDPKRIETIFKLVGTAKNSLLQGSLNATMAHLIKALQLYLRTPMLKKEREVLEEDFFELELKLAAHPKFKETYGPVSFVKGEHKMAVDFMGQLIQFGAEGIRDRIEQGLEMLAAGREDEARTIFFEVMDDPAVDLDEFIIIGDAYLQKSLWKDAQSVFSRAIQMYPESINLLNRMAISLRKDGAFAPALDVYRKAILLSPRDEGLYFNVARLFLEWGKPENAGQALRKALALNPGFESAAKLLEVVQQRMAGAAENTD